jgi:quercetin dioxygenase-like cupin family protein
MSASPRALTAADRPTHNVLGLPHTVLVSADDTGGGYELVEITGEPGLGVPPHVHQNEDETFYVVEGEVAFMLDGEERVCGPGTAVHLPRAAPHGFRIAGDGPARMLLTIAPGGLEPMFAGLAALPAGPPDPEAVGAICGRHGISFA